MSKHATPATEITQQITGPTTEIKEQIRIRAYDLYEQRGGEHGHDFDDWLQAELELTQQKAEKIAA